MSRYLRHAGTRTAPAMIDRDRDRAARATVRRRHAVADRDDTIAFAQGVIATAAPDQVDTLNGKIAGQLKP